jgi:predicted acyltransferase
MFKIIPICLELLNPHLSFPLPSLNDLILYIFSILFNSLLDLVGSSMLLVLEAKSDALFIDELISSSLGDNSSGLHLKRKSSLLRVAASMNVPHVMDLLKNISSEGIHDA